MNSPIGCDHCIRISAWEIVNKENRGHAYFSAYIIFTCIQIGILCPTSLHWNAALGFLWAQCLWCAQKEQESLWRRIIYHSRTEVLRDKFHGRSCISVWEFAQKISDCPRQAEEKRESAFACCSLCLEASMFLVSPLSMSHFFLPFSFSVLCVVWDDRRQSHICVERL